MRHVLKKLAAVSAVAGGFLLAGAASAGAEEPEKSIASGNSAKVMTATGSPTVQVGASGNAVAVAGKSSARSGGSQTAAPSAATTSTEGPDEPKSGVASGNDVTVDVSGGAPAVQAGACGNAASVAGDASASCDGTQDASPSSESRSTIERDEGDGGVASGNAVATRLDGGAPTVQAVVCGNAVAVAGDASASCDGTQQAEPEATTETDATGAHADGIASGNDVTVDVSGGAPAVQAGACGNAVAVAGDASASCDGTQDASPSSESRSTIERDEGDGGIASGNAVAVQLDGGAPTVQAAICGNAVAVAGSSAAACRGDQSMASRSTTELDAPGPRADEMGTPVAPFGVQAVDRLRTEVVTGSVTSGPPGADGASAVGAGHVRQPLAPLGSGGAPAVLAAGAFPAGAFPPGVFAPARDGADASAAGGLAASGASLGRLLVLLILLLGLGLAIRDADRPSVREVIVRS